MKAKTSSSVPVLPNIEFELASQRLPGFTALVVPRITFYWLNSIKQTSFDMDSQLRVPTEKMVCLIDTSANNDIDRVQHEPRQR